VRSLRPSWPLLVGLASFLLVAGQLASVLNDPDTYLHVAAGNWMLAHRALPVSDPFSHSLAGAAWVPHEWLAELILALLWDWAGWNGPALAAAFCFALAMGIMTRRVLDRFEPLTGLILMASVVTLLEPHLLARAHELALPLMVIWSGATIAARDEGRLPPWWLLPVMTLWANLHGSFMAGLALLGYLGAEAVLQSPGERLAVMRRWAVFGLASGAAALVTPNGIDGFLLPFRLSSMPVLKSTFIEWQPPDLQSFQPIEIWIGAVVVALAAGLRLPILRALVLAVLFLNALAHQRHQDLLAIMGPLLIAAGLGPDLAARVRTERPSPVARGVAALARPAALPGTLAVLAIMALVAAVNLAVPLARPDSPITPAAALEAAQAAKLEGNVLNDEGFGGYLIAQGVPVFIDGRIELYGDDFLSAYLKAVNGHEPALDDLLEKYRIAWTMLPPGGVADEELGRSPAWRKIYGDKFAVVRARAEQP